MSTASTLDHKPAAEPGKESMVVMGEKKVQVDITHIVPFSAMCCSIASCYCKFPECIGGQGYVTCCCLHSEFILCKPTPDSQETCCILEKSFITCGAVRTCLKTETQLFCCDNRCALPCDNEVPCMYTMCFITCCVNWECKPAFCKSVGEITGQSFSGPNGQATAIPASST
jgi:hypothetical protein